MFTGSFSIAAGQGFNVFVDTDTSDYTDEPESTFLTRRVYLYKADGTLLSYAGAQTVPVSQGTNPVATITIDSVPANGSNITVGTSVAMGSIALGAYDKVGGDTTVDLIATHVASALSGSGYDISAAAAVVSIELDEQTDGFNGESLVITNTTVPETSAHTLVNMNSFISDPTGRLYTMTVNDPDDGIVTLATYTKQVGDTTAPIMAANFVTAISANIYGYSSIVQGDNLRPIARSGLGTSINGNNFTISWSGGSSAVPFFGGINSIGVIPNTTLPFSGGVSPQSETAVVDYIPFPFSLGSQITVNIPMLRDYAIRMVVEWVSLDPQSGSTYTATKYVLFEDYNNNALDGVVSAQTARPNVVQDATYLLNLANCFLEKDNAEIAITYGQQVLSQGAVNRESNYLSKQQTYF